MAANPALVASLRMSLAETWAFYFKAHSFHWNVRGPLFVQMHSFLGDLYDEVHGAVDGLAEHIRALDANAPFSLDEIAKPSSIKFSGQLLECGSMIMQLVSDNQAVIKALTNTNKHAVDAGSDGLANFIQDRLDKHAKYAWMLKSILDKG